jgi:hypothetical protein
MSEEKLSYEELERRYLLYKKIIQHVAAQHTGFYFICGASTETDSLGLPDTILVCPTYGSDIIQSYKKDGKASAPEW